MAGRELLNRLGRRMATPGAKAAYGIGMAGVAAHGFLKGVGDHSDQLYSFATGNPNLDQDVLGTSINPLRLMAPIPGGVADVAMNAPVIDPIRATASGVIGAGIGIAAGGIKGGIAGGVIGGAIGAASKFTAMRELGVLNKKMFSDYARGNDRPLTQEYRYNNRPPQIDGSIAFGMWNSRLGGG